MNNLIKLCFPAILIFAISYTQKELIDTPVFAQDVASNNNGLITTFSPYDVTQTSDRLESIIKEKGLTLFARIDHRANAANVELKLNPTKVLIFGNPKVGTPLMQCSATTAIDLPQKILVYQDVNNQTKIVYNDPQYLQQRHNISGCDSILEKVSEVLKNIVAEAVI